MGFSLRFPRKILNAFFNRKPYKKTFYIVVFCLRRLFYRKIVCKILTIEKEEEETEFQRVLAEIPDLEGDYSELSLGFNEELCLGNQVFQQDDTHHHHLQDDTQTITSPPASDVLTSDQEKSSADTNSKKKLLVEKVVKFVKPESSQKSSTISHSDPESSITEATSSLNSSLTSNLTSSLTSHAVTNAGLTVSCPPPVPIHRGDLIEFLVGERTWFLVEVTSAT